MLAGKLLVLDFGLGRFSEVGEIVFWIANGDNFFADTHIGDGGVI
jgi:hypothetical protein